jgi:prepilin-type N-terminal cleavage/methylation domain-containing protein
VSRTGPSRTLRRAGGPAGFTFLELLIVMALVAMLMGVALGWITSIGRSARSAQAASVLSETAFRCQNASAGGRRATLELRRRTDAEGNAFLVAVASVQRPILTANFEPPPKDRPDMDWFVSAGGGPDWAKPQGNVKLAEDEGTAVALSRGGWVDFGTRAAFAVTDGVGVDVKVKPAGGAGTMTLLRCVDDTQSVWQLRLLKDATSGADVYRVALTVWTVPEGAVGERPSGVGTPYQTKDACVPAGRWSRLQVSYDGREPSLRVDGVERYRAPARRVGKDPPPVVDGPAQRMTPTPNAVASITLSAPDAPYVGLVDALEVTGVFRSADDERVLADVDVVTPRLPLRVVYANGRLDPGRHLSDVTILLASPRDADGAGYEVRLGLYGDIPPPRRVLGAGTAQESAPAGRVLVPAAPATTPGGGK